MFNKTVVSIGWFRIFISQVVVSPRITVFLIRVPLFRRYNSASPWQLAISQTSTSHCHNCWWKKSVPATATVNIGSLSWIYPHPGFQSLPGLLQYIFTWGSLETFICDWHPGWGGYIDPKFILSHYIFTYFYNKFWCDLPADAGKISPVFL